MSAFRNTCYHVNLLKEESRNFLGHFIYLELLKTIVHGVSTVSFKVNYKI